MSWYIVTLGILALGIGFWIGIGAPGWPHKPSTGRRHRDTRPINPVAWGRRGTSHHRVHRERRYR